MPRRQLRAQKNFRADVTGNDFDLDKNKFSYKRLKELESKVPEFLAELSKRRSGSFQEQLTVTGSFRLVEELKTNHATGW